MNRDNGFSASRHSIFDVNGFANGRAGYQAIPSLRWQENVGALLKQVRRKGLVRDKGTAALVAFIERNPANAERVSQLLRCPGVMEALNNPDPFEEVPELNVVDGPVRLGKCLHNDATFGLSSRELLQGTLVVGRPGAGKTTLGCNLIEAAVQNGFTCIAIDVKQDYRHLIRKILKSAVIFPENLEALIVPEGVRTSKHVSMFADVVCESFAVYEGTKNYLTKHLHALYQRRSQPILPELYEAVTKEKHPHYSREARYQESAESRLGAMVLRAESDSPKKIYRLEQLANECDLIVIELDRLDRTGRICYASLILGSLYEYRIENNLRGGTGKPLLVLIDEGNEIFIREYERKHGGTTLTSFLRQGREFGIAPVCFCHLLLDLSDNLKNVHTRILMSLGEGFNLKSMAESMGLTPEQRDADFSLGEGQAIVRMATRYDKPFVIQCFPYPIEKNVSDDEVKKHMKPFEEKFSEELEAASPVEIDAEAEVRDANSNGNADGNHKGHADGKAGTENKKPVGEQMPAKLKTFLTDAYNHPFVNLTTRYKELGLSSSAGDSVKDQLLRRGLCEALEITTGGRGSSAKYLAFTDAGFTALGVEPNHRINASNFRHSFWEDRIVKWAAPIGKAELERLIQNKHVDVAIATERGIIAVEVELTSAYTKQNVEKDLEVGCVKVILACPDGKVLDEVRAIVSSLEESVQGKVKACLLTELTRNEPGKWLSVEG